ncbi:outer membrane protein [Pelagibacterium sediminicola]|uniref:outer membrane protein n=1 Tax=Pelagibacterium sediminicola TaxID=2248761 RepID=UPI001FE9396C|nr:outer membrane beta-barrel protein [Pelagibacterium sediminicola]
MKLKSILLAGAAVVAVSGAALAADPIMPTPVVPVAPIPAAFDWNGFYAGVRVGAENQVAPISDTDWLIGVEIGVNAAYDMFVMGAELAVDAVFEQPDAFAYGEITARGGVLVAPEVLVYGTVGYGTDFGSTVPQASGAHVLAGLGAEFAVTDSVSLDARYVYGWSQTAGKTDIHKFTVGANFHF